MRKYTQNDIEIGDYVKLKDCDDFHKVTDKSSTHINLITEGDMPTTATAQEIEDLLLASEMNYAF